MWQQIRSNWILILIVLLVLALAWNSMPAHQHSTATVETDSNWHAPSIFLNPIANKAEREAVVYGRELIANTAQYLGPRGTVAQISNGMNCQNCHLDAGTRPLGNNFSAVYANYPKYRDRSGGYESIYKRVSDCFERSLNGSAPDSNSREYRAIYAYIRWLGQRVPQGTQPQGSGLHKPAYLNRAADPKAGQLVYTSHCASCHGANGEGQTSTQNQSYQYPPLWGAHSYNTGAGLYRISNFAAFVWQNMPYTDTKSHPVLSATEAWDVAAFVNSQPRPQKDLSGDWPDIRKKPVDYPFGPYADGFSEQQHKYGPYQPLLLAREKN